MQISECECVVSSSIYINLCICKVLCYDYSNNRHRPGLIEQPLSTLQNISNRFSDSFYLQIHSLTQLVFFSANFNLFLLISFSNYYDSAFIAMKSISAILQSMSITLTHTYILRPVFHSLSLFLSVARQNAHLNSNIEMVFLFFGHSNANAEMCDREMKKSE